ncbi:hypothetical protein AB0G74_07870 [Streptomyces sp. NPDC020875]|uniref:hypothetical protein n=1 Tax=Streptomyces sp. NPDC020875 TaxID=3154898 RepID=UPI0033DF266D
MRDGYDEGTGADGTGPDGDALMAVLMGEPVPEGDPAAGRAARDMAVLAEQLKLIGGVLASDADGEAAAGPVPAGSPPAAPVTAPAGRIVRPLRLRSRPARSRPGADSRPGSGAGNPERRRTVLALAASAAVLATLLGAAALVQYYVAAPGDSLTASDIAAEKGTYPRASTGEESAAKRAPAKGAACARLIAEGTVVAAGTEKSDGGAGSGRFTVTLDVDTHLQPGQGLRRERVVFPPGTEPEVRIGTRMLVVVPSDPDQKPLYYLGDDVPEGRDRVQEDLSGERGLVCPGRG